MTDNDREKIALFRFSLISPILNGQVVNQKEYLAEVTAKVHDVPYYGPKEYVPKTVQGWLRDYHRGGFEALKPKKRSDRGKSRKIYPELKANLLKLRRENMNVSVSLFYDQLIAKKIILPSDISYSTVYRMFKREDLLYNSPRKEGDRRRFAHDTVNALWQGDFMVGPYLKLNGKKIRTNLFAFIDDCSRVVPYAMFLTSEKFSSLRTVFSEALLRRGLPKLLYVDNGKIYRSDMLHLACAALGITLIHTKPYDAASKGKIERFFLTVRKRFLPLLTEDDLCSLDRLNQRFFDWLETDYHRKVHSSLATTPLDKFMSQIDQVKVIDDPERLKLIFLKREKRKVKHDRTISVNSELYEVPPALIGKRIEIRFDPETYEQIFIYDDGYLLGQARKVIFADNAHVKRNRNISFQNILNEGDH
jgi:putative transposase